MTRWEFNPRDLEVVRHLDGLDIAGIVLMIIFWAAVVTALVFAIRALIIYSRKSRPLGPDGRDDSGAAVSETPSGAGPTVTVTAPADAPAADAPTAPVTAQGGATPVTPPPTSMPAVAPQGTLLAILEERYARGEIDRDEFLQRKQDLGIA